MLRFILAALGLLAAYFSAYSQNPLVNFPSLNADGSKIAFNYQGDIWTADSDGTNLRRITVHEAYDTYPLWSADGKQIAFYSNRYGNNDIFLIPAEGGIPKRLTYHSASDVLTDYAKDGSILFNTKRNFNQIEWEPEIETVSEKGGTPYVKVAAFGYDATLSPNGRFVAFVKGPCRIQREEYYGPANKDIWIYDTKNDRFNKVTDDIHNDFYPKWADDHTLYYQSAKSGRYNVHRLQIDSEGKKKGKDQQVTHFKDMGIFSFNISRNGEKIVLVKGDELYVVNAGTGKQQKIDLNIHSDYRFDPVERKTFTGKLESVVPSPNSKLSAFVIRGEIFITENDKEKSRTVNLTQNPFRDQSPVWLSDNRIIFVSDRNGQNDLYLLESADPAEKNLFRTLKFKTTRLTKTKEEESRPVIAPDKKQLAFLRGRGQLVVAQITEKGKLGKEIVLEDGWDTPSGIAWSPDSQWIAYALSDLDFNDEIYIQKADGTGKRVNVSMHPKRDSSPVWSPDGSKLAFSSIRNNGDDDVWFVWLKKSDWQRTKADWDELEDIEKDAKKDEKKDADKIKPVVIDLDDIYKRQVQVTAYVGGEFVKGFSKDGKTLYYTTGSSGRGNSKADADLFKIKWDGKDRKAVTKGNTAPRNVVFDEKDKYVYFTSKGGKLNRIKLKDDKKEALPVKAIMEINYPAESEQIFEEAWRAIDQGFYDPEFQGHDWNQLKKVYKPLAMKASTRADFRQIFNWMLGQVNASHMGLRGGEQREKLQKEKTGLLGITVKPLKSGAVKVLYVTQNMPADREMSLLKEGDEITAVNGMKLSKEVNFFSLLNGKSNDKIYLTLKTADGARKEVVIRPKSANRTEKYEDWVAAKKRLTDKYSNRKLGYIHIQGMNWTSFETFERELAAAGYGKKGVVIDVRFNGGGWTTDYLMAVLTVRQHAYTVPRGAAKNPNKEHPKFKDHYPYSERLPLTAWTKPSVALCNESSYSNAEIFSHAYKNLGIGPLVGIQTFGAVISTGGHGLMDGSYVRMPFRGWYVKATGKNMEFNGAMPDYVVPNPPDNKAKGEDLQLKKAVDELMKKIK